MSADGDDEETWREFFVTNKSIPPHHARNISNPGSRKYTFCLNLKSINAVFQSQAESEFQLRLTFYDAANNYFFGSPWIGPIIESTPTSKDIHVIDCNEAVYFYSSINDVTIILVFELVHAKEETLETVGWSWLRIFLQYNSLADTEETVRPQEKRLDFYYGSPLALLHIPEPLEEYPNFTKIKGCLMLYTLQTHEALESVLQYIPENSVISGDDIVPGVDEIGDDSGFIDILRNPQPTKLWPCHLNKLLVTLLPSVEGFEDCLCKYLNEDRLKKDEMEADGTEVSIAERKLKVGVHNGWQFVKPPHIVFLEKRYTQPSPDKFKRSSSRPESSLSNTTKECIGLVLSSRLELNEMVNHPSFAIAFVLEYVVNIPIAQPELPTNKTTRNKLGSSYGSIPLAKKISLGIRTAVWVPFENGLIKNQPITLELRSGEDHLNPFDNLIFANSTDFFDDAHFESLGKIEFSFFQTKAKRFEASLSRSQSRDFTQSNDELQRVNVTPTQGDRSPMTIHDLSIMEQQGVFVTKPPLPINPQKTGQDGNIVQAMEVQHLAELPRSQMYSSLVIPSTDTKHAAALSRVAHSLLYTIEYPKIVDAQGNPPFIINPEETVSYNLALENRDRLHTNDITIQFLAVSRCNNRSVFFTFQFYRFPQTTTERLHIKRPDGTDTTHPCVLQRSARDGKPSTYSPPGLTVRYTVDPAYMQAGEKNTFLKYLHEQKLYIDMWDGDSLLLIGSTSTPLKYLLRQMNSAVQVSQELDILFTEYSDDHPMLAGDLIQAGAGYPSGMKVSLQAKLCLRMANVGFLPETNPEKLQHLTESLQTSVVQQKEPVNKRNADKLQPAMKSTAKLMSDCDAELASVLLTRKPYSHGRSEKMKKDDANSARKRKLDRMKAVRQVEGDDTTTSGYILQHEEKVQRTRDLVTIQKYRNKVKGQVIQNKLEDCITTRHVLHSSLGYSEYFEFALRNPYPEDQVVYITVSDKELKVIIDSREWRYYKQLIGTNTAMEDQMFSSANEESVKLFLRASEKVFIPFKFQNFTSYNVTPEMGPSHPLHTQAYSYSLQTFGKDTTLSSKEIKVTFAGNEMKPLAFLIVAVELHPHPIHQTFRFYHPEQSFLKKAIRLPPLHSIPGASVESEQKQTIHVTARCSDDSVICESYQVVAGEPQEVFLKVPCALSPSVKRFFVLVFRDEFCSKPCQIWQIYVHSLQRIDMTATEGQTTKLSVLLKGTQSSRMVKCFPSHPAEMKVAPRDHFMLVANGVQELCLKVIPLMAGRRMMFMNVVDQEFHQLVKSWLVVVSSTPPVVTKAFEVRLPVGGGSGANKKISFLNPYPVKKTFHFKTNRTDLLTFKENGIMLGGGETHNIGLSFISQQSEGEATILIFINDRDGKNEETFCVRVSYYQ